MKRIRILNVPFDVLTMDDAVAWVDSLLKSEAQPRGACHIATVNPEIVMIARGNSRFMQVLERCELVVADGIGIVWAAEKLGIPLPERIPGIELAEAIIALAAQSGKKVFLLGGREGVADEAAARLQASFPGLHVSGTANGYFGQDEQQGIIEKIAASGTDILFAGLGAPRQELWLAEHKEDLGAKVVMGVGGSLDHFAGRVRRAPRVFRRLHLEWAYRLMAQPSRWRRMGAIPRFVWAILKDSRGGHGSGED